MATKSKSKKSVTMAVDFSDTESAGIVPEDDYIFEVEEVTRETSDNSGEDYLSWKLKIAEGEYKGRHLYHNTSLQPQALFNLRALLEALGVEVPQGKMELDLDEYVDMRGACSVAHEKYKGKTKARPVEFFTEEELEKRASGEEAEDEKPKGKKDSKGKKEEADEKPKGKDKKEPEPDDEPTLADVKAAAAKVDGDELKKILKKFKVKQPKDLDEDKFGEFIEACEEAAGDDEAEFEVGDTVTFTDDEGDEKTGEITEIDGDDYTVRVGKGKKAVEFTLEKADMTKVED